MTGMVRAIRLHPDDTVATLLGAASRGATIAVSDGASLEARDDIGIYFKVAIEPVAAGQPIVKYGQPIGFAARDIARGDRVHTENLSSTKGRGCAS